MDLSAPTCWACSCEWPRRRSRGRGCAARQTVPNPEAPEADGFAGGEEERETTAAAAAAVQGPAGCTGVSRAGGRPRALTHSAGWRAGVAVERRGRLARSVWSGGTTDSNNDNLRRGVFYTVALTHAGRQADGTTGAEPAPTERKARHDDRRQTTRRRRGGRGRALLLLLLLPLPLLLRAAPSDGTLRNGPSASAGGVRRLHARVTQPTAHCLLPTARPAGRSSSSSSSARCC